MNIINLTPHGVTIHGGDTPITLPPSGQVARITMVREQAGTLCGVPVYRSTPGPVMGLPEPQAGVALLVSALVRLALPGRADLYSPGELVRDSSGQPIGCRGLEGQ
jgi:hypothetical protein